MNTSWQRMIIMSRMNGELLKMIGAEKGAASPITQREATGDKSVTLDRYEKEVLQDFYPDMDFPRKGGGGGNEVNEEFQFYIHDYNDLESANLRSVSIVYPKRKGNELRMYFNTLSGFTIDSDTYLSSDAEGKKVHWYIYRKSDDEFPHIGMADSDYLSGYLLQFRGDALTEEPDDSVYQTALQNELAGERVLLSALRYRRNIREAAMALEHAGFLCEVDPTHKTFTSAATGKPYVEGHHLIPISHQDEFEHSIDVKENIVALCPNCHRLVHHGINEEKEGILLKLWIDRRESLLQNEIKIDAKTFLEYYLI